MDNQTELLALKEQVEALQNEINALRSSDLQQWAKLRTQQRKIQGQQRNNAMFAGVIAIGVLLGVGELTSEDKASLQQVLVAVIVATGGAGGIIGANSIKPPEGIEDDGI